MFSIHKIITNTILYGTQQEDNDNYISDDNLQMINYIIQNYRKLNQEQRDLFIQRMNEVMRGITDDEIFQIEENQGKYAIVGRHEGIDTPFIYIGTDKMKTNCNGCHNIKENLFILRLFMLILVNSELKVAKQILSRKKTPAKFFNSLIYSMTNANMIDWESPVKYIRLILNSIQYLAEYINQEQHKQMQQPIDCLLEKAIESIKELILKIQSNKYKLLYQEILIATQELKNTMFNQNKTQSIKELKKLTNIITIHHRTNQINNINNLRISEYIHDIPDDIRRVQDVSFSMIVSTIKKFNNLQDEINTLTKEIENKSLKKEQLEIAKQIKTEAEKCIAQKIKTIKKFQQTEDKYAKVLIENIKALDPTNPKEATRLKKLCGYLCRFSPRTQKEINIVIQQKKQPKKE